MQIRTKDFTERRIAVEAEMASLYDAAEKAGEDLTGEKLERWNALKVEKTDRSHRAMHTICQPFILSNASINPTG